MKIRVAILLLFFSVPLVFTPGRAQQAAPPEARIKIDVDRTTGELHPLAIADDPAPVNAVDRAVRLKPSAFA